MTVRSPGRVPGPLGVTPVLVPAGSSGRAPLGLVPIVVATPASVAKAGKAKVVKLNMIETATDNKSKEVKDVKWGLYPKKNPHYTDPQQSDVLMGCALASILSALANTPVGDQHIKGMIKTLPSGKGASAVSVHVNLSKVAGSLASSPGPMIKSKRYFNVKVAGKTQKVSSVFYTDESSNVIMIYMKSPNNALWPCVLEKAYAKHLNKNGYAVFENFANPERVWQDIVGQKPGRLHLARAGSGDIKRVAKAATSTPTIAASKGVFEGPDVTPDHGFAVIGYRSGKVRLYDPMGRKEYKIGLRSFKKDFTDMFFGKP